MVGSKSVAPTMLNLADNRLSDAGLLALIAAAAAGDALGQLTELTLGAFPYAAWHQDVCSASELGPYPPFEGRNEFSDEALEALAAAAGARCGPHARATHHPAAMPARMSHQAAATLGCAA